MCGRYVLWEVDKLNELFNVDGLQDLEPNYNTAPTHLMPVYSELGLTRMQWGLIPSWAKDEKIGYKLFNTRSETVFEKPMWKGIVKRNRCLVPANGFYEWKQTDDGKVPYYIHLPNEELFSFAGIWETWKHNGKDLHTFSILTTIPNKEMQPIHDRMPVILNKDSYDMWLHEDDRGAVESLLHPLPNGALNMHEVPKTVNTARANDRSLILPSNST